MRPKDALRIRLPPKFCETLICKTKLERQLDRMHYLSTGKLRSVLTPLPVTQRVAAAQRRPRAPQLLREALCTAPATKSALPRNLPSRLVHQVRCLPHKRQPRPSGDHARHRYCAYHEICTPGAQTAVPATKSPLQVHQVLCLPHKR